MMVVENGLGAQDEVDENNKITYVEYCKDVINEPDYESALNAVK